MNAEQLLHHFDQIAEVPDAVARLRWFVLNLAFRGKLVSQNLKDESASELLKRIATKKKNLIKEGKLRNSSSLKQISPNEAAFAIPDSWIWLYLQDTYDVRDGTHDTPKYLDQGIPFVTSKNLVKGKIDFSTVKYISLDDHLRFSERSKVERYDILFAMIGSIGNPVITEGEDFSCKNVAIFKYYDLSLSHPRFLYYFLLYAFEEMREKALGGVQPFVSLKFLREYPMPLPPLAEQHRIVAKVDELMALCDELEAARAQRETRRDQLVAATLHSLVNDPGGHVSGVTNSPGATNGFAERARFYFNHLPRLTTRPEHIKQLRQTILNLAVRGKLVPQDPNDEPAADLLLELCNAKNRLQNEENIRNREPVERIKRSDIGYSIPTSWELPSFDDLFVIVSGVTKGRNLAGLNTVELPYLRVANVQRGYLDLAIMKTIQIPENERARYQLRIADILMTEGGDWDKLGRAAIWMNNVPDCIHQNHVFRVRPPLPEKLLSKWVITYTNSTLGRSYFEDASKQTTNLASINMTQLRGCPLPLPPLAEQQRIVAKVDELMALCDALEAQLTTNAATRRQLLEATLHAALQYVE